MTVRLIEGHVLDKLKEIPQGSVQTCVTSPPFWQLRNYGLEPQVWDSDENCTHIWMDYLPAAKETHTNEGFADRVGPQYRGGGHKAAAAAEKHRPSNSG